MTLRRTLLLSILAVALVVAFALVAPGGLGASGVPGPPADPGAGPGAAAPAEDAAAAPGAESAPEAGADGPDAAGDEGTVARSAAADVPEDAAAERLRARAVAAREGDAETLRELMAGEDYAAYRAARDLVATEGLPAEARLAALERVLALRIDEPLARDETRALHLAIGSVAEAANRPERALEAYRETLPDEAAIAGVKRLVDDPYRRANLLLQGGADAAALEALDGRAAPSIEAPALRALGRHEEALAAYRRWLEEVPGDATARSGLAWSHWYLGDLDAADAAFAELAGPNALYGRALIANRRGDVDRAVELLRATERPNRLWLATDLLERDERFAEAAEIYLDLAALGGTYADDAAWRALVLGRRLGDPALVEAAEASVPEGSYFDLRAGGEPELPTRRDLDPVRPAALDTAAWLAEAGDLEGARGVLAFALRDARTEAEIVALGEALVALEEYRVPQRAAAGLLAEGSEQLRTWRLAYPRAWPEQVVPWAEEAGVPPELVWAVIRKESAFHPDAVSRSGAQGLMQVMPTTWDWIAELRNEEPADAFDPHDNLRYGIHYLGWLSDYFDGDLELVVPSYNRGQGYIRRLFEGEEVAGDKDELLRAIDALETREYLQSVWVSYRTYQALERAGEEPRATDASATAASARPR